VLAGCTSNEDDPQPAGNNAAPSAGGGGNDQPGTMVTIGFSSPAADHGWTGAVSTNAKAQAQKYSDVKFEAVEGAKDANEQIGQIETLINKKVDVLVLLPHDGKALNEAGLKAMAAGIPVVNLDRIFPSERAYRTYIGGDNYGMGLAAGQYIITQLKARNVTDPVIAEIAGTDSLPLTQDRSRGFKDALAAAGLRVSARVAAGFTVESGNAAAANLLQAQRKIDAVWNHDDDQGIGVLAAMDQAGRKEFFMVGGAGSANAMNDIKADRNVLKATVTYNPSMASSAVKLARLIAQNRGMGDLVEHEVPKSIILASATVTKDNVDQYMAFGFKS
jgi:ribose transport system substrate-binding protein